MSRLTAKEQFLIINNTTRALLAIIWLNPCKNHLPLNVLLWLNSAKFLLMAIIKLCKTNFDMNEIKAEEADYANHPLPKFYTFPSVDARERILYANFERVNQDVKDMILEIQMEFKK